MASVKRTLGELFGKWVLKELEVVRVESVSEHFRRVDLGGEPLKSAAFTPGDKLQLLLDDGFRTYTPYSFDAARGVFSLLFFLHGEGTPGVAFARAAKVGDKVMGFGPRGSIPLPALASPISFFGDETSFAAARALHETGKQARYFFEVNDPVECEAVLTGLELLPKPLLLERRADDSHLAALAPQLEGGTLVLTGRAAAIQRIRGALRLRPKAPPQKVKAYWASGKKGLD
jgi:ferric-chelate reductase (NADPH)